MKTVSAAQAKAKFAELLDEAAKGETVTITRHGKPVVKIVPTAGEPEWRSIIGAMKDKGPIPDNWKEPDLEELIMMGLVVYESDPVARIRGRQRACSAGPRGRRTKECQQTTAARRMLKAGPIQARHTSHPLGHTR